MSGMDPQLLWLNTISLCALIVICDANFTQVHMFVFSSHMIEMITEVYGKVKVLVVPFL